MPDLEAAKTAYINQWTHCGRKLSAASAQISCECGHTWPWESTLGETMEWLALMEEVHQPGVEGPPMAEQPKLFGQ